MFSYFYIIQVVRSNLAKLTQNLIIRETGAVCLSEPRIERIRRNTGFRFILSILYIRVISGSDIFFFYYYEFVIYQPSEFQFFATKIY